MLYKQRSSSFIFVFFYTFLIITLIVINAVSGFGLLSDNVLNVCRGLVHFLPLTAFIILYIHNNQSAYIKNNLYFNIRQIISLCMVILMLLSALLNGPITTEIVKTYILLLHIFNVTVLLPLSLSYIDLKLTIHSISKYYCRFLAGISLLVLFFNYQHTVGYVRLGYPYIPGVYAYLCLVALAVSLTILKSKIYPLFFFFNIFLSGSRSALVIAVIFLLVTYLYQLSIKRFIAITLILFSILLVLNTFEGISKPYTIEREDISSGRLEIWTKAIIYIKDAPFLGHSKSITFSGIAENADVVSHNSFLDLSIRYGIIFAVLSYLYFLSFLPNMLKADRSISSTGIGLLFLFLIIVKSMVTNVFWTNMGDGASYFVLIIISIISVMPASRILTYDSKKNQL